MVLSKRRQEGYLLVDHRFSPGLTEEQARLSGYDPTLTKEGKMFEAATLTCSHCKVSVVKNPSRLRERAFCQKCFHYICDLCAVASHRPDYDHMPFERVKDLSFEAGQRAQAGSPAPLILPPVSAPPIAVAVDPAPTPPPSSQPEKAAVQNG